MIIIIALILVLIAGFINGSFATPMKYMTRWEEEDIWLVFSLWGFIILPWISLLIMVPDALGVIKALPPKLFWTMILGGMCFGLGQIAFATSFRYIGIGLAFVINISMGTSGSALIPLLWHKGIMGTTYGYLHIIGIIIFVIAVCFGAAAGSARDKTKAPEEIREVKTKQIKKGMLLLGIVLAILAGIGSVAQGVTYIWANPSVTKIAADSFGHAGLGASIIAWVLIFSAAWIPYFLYFLILSLKRKSLPKIFGERAAPYWILTILMGIGFWGSLIFFSQASNEIGGDLAPTIAWPLFMVFIILTSNFWSVKSGEWMGAGSQAVRRMVFSLSLFVAAIVVFSYSSKFQPPSSDAPEDKYHKVHFMHIKHANYPTHKQELEIRD